ncbi:MAG: hypothetical protein OXB92_11885 [Acidimicrobiaceae bacterium]|nr:hypothetical protein [Acidimicrobiia bacterium]MCY4494546.1 hypothetical protein [Acidimicrobiaceae bacterium]
MLEDGWAEIDRVFGDGESPQKLEAMEALHQSVLEMQRKLLAADAYSSIRSEFCSAFGMTEAQFDTAVREAGERKC